jgi:hypothetical protein
MSSKHNSLISAVFCLVTCLSVGVGCSSGQVGDPEGKPKEWSTFSGDPTKPEADKLSCNGIQAGPSPMRLLTRIQYDNTVKTLLGVLGKPSSKFPPENKASGFNNNATVHQVNPLLVSRYVEAAEGLAQEAVDNGFGVILPCDPTVSGEESCGTEFVRTFGKRAFRRSLDEVEFDAFWGLFQKTLQESDFKTAIQRVIEATLQSPQFLYRIEQNFGMDAEKARKVPVPQLAIATRLSYFLWNNMPDDVLIEAAEKNKLGTEAEVTAQVRRMLDDPQALETIQDFHKQWLKTDGLSVLVKDDPSFQGSATQLRNDLEKSLMMFIQDNMWGKDGSVTKLFTSNKFSVSPTMAKVYGIAMEGNEWQTVTLESDKYSGLLTHPAMMALLSEPAQSSPVRRGVFVRQQILCQALQPPPPNLMVTPPDPDPSLTTRERFREHTANPACAQCHKLIDSIGFGFENFDELGRFRGTENGLKVDGSGSIWGALDTTINKSFANASELSAMLSTSTQVYDCVARQWFRYSMGRVESRTDECSVQSAKQALVDSGGKLSELLVALAVSEAFRYEDLKAAPTTSSVTGGQP